MKFLLFLPSTDRGGGEQFGIHLAKLLRDSQHHVTVCHPLVPATKSLMDEFRSLGCVCIRWHCGETCHSDWPEFAIQVREAEGVLADTLYDHAILVLPDPISAFGPLYACLRSISRVTLIFQLCAEPFIVPCPIRNEVRHAGSKVAFLSVSREAAGRIAQAFGMSADGVHVIHNSSGHHFMGHKKSTPVALRAALGIPLGGRMVLSVGRVTEQKGYRVLLASAPHVLSRFPDTHFLWLGRGEEEGAFRSEIRRHAMERRVHLAGWSDRVYEYLQAADMFVLPSLWEGTPLALSEAMSAGCPVIATRVGGIPEMAAENEIRFVDPCAPQQLSAAIIDGICNRSLFKEMAHRARNRWERDHRSILRDVVGALGLDGRGGVRS